MLCSVLTAKYEGLDVAAVPAALFALWSFAKPSQAMIYRHPSVPN